MPFGPRKAIIVGVTKPEATVRTPRFGSSTEGLTDCACGEIGARLLASAPDVTRLVDRLEVKGLVERVQVQEDRRLSMTRITKKGLRLLNEIHPHIAEEHKLFGDKVSPRDCLELLRICELIYNVDVD